MIDYETPLMITTILLFLIVAYVANPSEFMSRAVGIGMFAVVSVTGGLLLGMMVYTYHTCTK
jgi:hypothetical protein